MPLIERTPAALAAIGSARKLAALDPIAAEQFLSSILSLVREFHDRHYSINSSITETYDLIEPSIGETRGADQRDQT